jgi:FkbM family methyltransferase
MLSTLKGLIPEASRNALHEAFGARKFARLSYSQEGEDLVLLRLFENDPPGVFVDVGAHHPFRFSNTFLLYQRGWRGINIDARPGGMDVFRRRRPRDISIELGVSEAPGRLEFHVFAEPALNTFDPALARERLSLGWPMTGTQWVECLPLAQILRRELPALGASDIDLLTIDVEGLDLQVLRSNDWGRFRPRAVVVEVLASDVAGLMKSDIAALLSGVGYEPFAKLVNSAVFLRNA